MKNTNLKTGLFFGLGMTIYFIVSGLFRIDDYTAFSLTKVFLSSIFGGIFCGAFFGYFCGIIVRKLTKSIPPFVPQADEDLLYESPANHRKGIENVGGKLFLTNKRLVFESHRFNIQNHETEIMLSDIVIADRFNNFGMNNGIAIKCKNSKIEKFIVSAPGMWIERLKSVS